MGALRRRIRIVTANGEARGALEDDFHHFRVAIGHNSERITHIQGDAVRYPYISCPGAPNELIALVGNALNGSLPAVANYTDRLKQCTHLYDLSCLVITAIADQALERIYDVQVDDPQGDLPESDLPEGGLPGGGLPRAATLRCNGRLVLDWQLDGLVIHSEDSFNGVDVRGGFRRHLDSTALSRDQTEQASVLRRGIFISRGRFDPWDITTGEQAGGCYTLQPERIGTAVLITDNSYDFTHTPEQLTAADNDWLTVQDGAFIQPSAIPQHI